MHDRYVHTAVLLSWGRGHKQQRLCELFISWLSNRLQWLGLGTAVKVTSRKREKPLIYFATNSLSWSDIFKNNCSVQIRLAIHFSHSCFRVSSSFYTRRRAGSYVGCPVDEKLLFMATVVCQHAKVIMWRLIQYLCFIWAHLWTCALPLQFNSTLLQTPSVFIVHMRLQSTLWVQFSVDATHWTTSLFYFVI